MCVSRKKSRTTKTGSGRLPPNRSIVGNLKKSFSQAYTNMEDEVDRDPLVSGSSRYFSEEDLLEVGCPPA